MALAQRLVVLGLVVTGVLGLAAKGLPNESTEDSPAPELETRVFRVGEFFRERAWYADRMGLTDVLSVFEPFEAACDYFGDSGISFGPPGPQDLRDLVQRNVNITVHPGIARWADEGGPATIDYVTLADSSMLVVTQTPLGLSRIQDLLRDMRRHLETGGPMLSVYTRWVAVDESNVDALVGTVAKRKVPAVIDAKDLEVAHGRTLYRAAATTFDGMRTFIAAGTLRTYVADLEPLVCGGYVGTSPRIEPMLIGGYADVRASIMEDRKTVLLDYLAYVNHAGETQSRLMASPAKKKDIGGASPLEVELPTVDVQTLRGSARIPLDKTVLLGLTTGPDLKEGTVYALVVEVSASAGE